MKALSITALIFSALAIFIPVIGIGIAMVCSLLALLAYYKSPTLSGITFGINIMNAAFLSPIVFMGGVNGYWYFLGFHLFVLLLALLFSLVRHKNAVNTTNRYCSL